VSIRKQSTFGCSAKTSSGTSTKPLLLKGSAGNIYLRDLIHEDGGPLIHQRLGGGATLLRLNQQ
jgi:hypothetical protein